MKKIFNRQQEKYEGVDMKGSNDGNGKLLSNNNTAIIPYYLYYANMVVQK